MLFELCSVVDYLYSHEYFSSTSANAEREVKMNEKEEEGKSLSDIVGVKA